MMINKFFSKLQHKKTRYKKIAVFYGQFILISICAGWICGIFSLGTDQAYLTFKQFFVKYPLGVFIITPLLFMGIMFLFKRYFPYAGGSGLPQGYALDVYDKPVLYSTYSLWTMIGKIILTTLTVAGGAALGREGPTVQICASIFGSLKNVSLYKKKLLIRIGSGVGVLTAFNAPLGGIVFAIEEYLKTSNIRTNTLLLLAVAVAGQAGIMIYGDYSYMGTISMKVLAYQSGTILWALLAGIICGLTGALFTYLMVYVSVDKGQRFHQFRRKHYLITAGIFGFLLALMGFFSEGASFGNGAFEMHDILTYGKDLPWYYGIAKAFGAIFSVGAGVPGGYFSTALSIGAGIMHAFHRLFPVLPLEQFYLLGMAGFLTAITDAPLTAVAMIISIVVGSQHFMLPIIISSLVAARIASLFGDSVYHQQALIYIDRSRYAETR